MSRVIIPARTVAAHHAGSAYGMHQLLWRLFSDGPDRSRDFLFHRTDNDGRTECLVISNREPVNVLPGIKVETKVYDPKTRAGQILEFNVKVNPVIRSTSDGKRHDVIMHARKQAGDSTRELNEPVLAWLTRRQEAWGCAFVGPSVTVAGYERAEFERRNHRVVVSLCDVRGLLEVKDPEKFRRMLFSGIGAARAFGCGMVLVRPTTYAAAA